ncbi:hypothetical protein MMA231_01649 [Asticcacaulis sp. MM231]|uniref:hypothetical protein n=1 Tax=Asticcacaulis sp. MM231 TaxID=3157666 RepID=UPI0032D58EEB
MRDTSAFSVTKALKASTGFLPQAWAGVWLSLLVVLALVIGGPMAAIAFKTPLAGLALVLLLVIVKLVTHGGLYRVALFGKSAREEGLGFGGFQFGPPEWRLLAASLVVTAFFALMVATLFIVFAIALSFSGLTHGYDTTMQAVQALIARHDGIDYLFIAYIIGSFIFLVFVGLKFALLAAANIAERRLVTLNALGLTSGHVGRICLGLLVILLPFVLICDLVSQRLGHVGQTRLVVHAALMGLYIFLFLPLTVGFLADSYRQIVTIRSK